MTIIINTPTGKIGSRVTEKLLAARAKLTLLVRNPEKLDNSARNQTTVYQGSLLDTVFVQRATKGSQAMFWVTPSNFAVSDVLAWYQQFGEVAAQVVQANQIPYLVNISSGGGQVTEAGPVSALHEVERIFNRTATKVLHLRCGYFMENFLMQLQSMWQDGCLYFPVVGNIPIPMIATRDIADVAATKLLERSWTAQSNLALHGPADLSFEEAANILGDVIGKPIRHVHVTAEQCIKALQMRGASANFAHQYVLMFKALSQGNYAAEPRTQETTTPTTLKQWAEEVMVPLLEQNLSATLLEK
jgi:uncharacterized protein YbjT (DUF2867 family)